MTLYALMLRLRSSGIVSSANTLRLGDFTHRRNKYLFSETSQDLPLGLGRCYLTFGMACTINPPVNGK